MLRNKFGFVFAVVSFVFLLLAGYLFVQRYMPISSLPSINTDQASVPSAVIQINIPDLNLSLPVYQADLKGTKWEYSSRGVSHLSSTPWPDQGGNSVFYGHNWPNIFSPLQKAKVGQDIILVTSAGNRLSYRVSDIQVVTPDRVDVLDQTIENRLTIFTCTGFLDSKRLVLIALPK